MDEESDEGSLRCKTKGTSVGKFFTKATIFLLVDLREKKSDLGSGGTKKINKKALKMTS